MPTELPPELKNYINQYFKEYHIKDCIVILPANQEEQITDINIQLGQIINSVSEKTKFIIQHVSSSPGTEGLNITIKPMCANMCATNCNHDVDNTYLATQVPNLENGDELHELISDYLSRLAILVDKTTSRTPKPAAIWKHRNFLSSISHQIKTPLSAIFSGSKLIKHYINDDRIDRICEYMNQSCVELTRYMNDIIDFYYLKQDTLILENTPVIISDTLGYVYENYKLQLIDAGITFYSQISPNIPEIYCDEHRLTQILMNLINNSVKFTSHPKLEDDINQIDSHDNKIININAIKSGDKLIIQVADTGIGRINLDDQEIYFQPFNQTTRNWLCAPDGIGLGLCLSRDFARKMGGDLYFITPPTNLHDSSCGFNTCIELVLPILHNKPSTTNLKSTVTINPSTTHCQNELITQQLVLIDDNQTNLELLTLILQQLGYDISQLKTFTNSLEGQQYIIQNSGVISHAIIDIRMPRKNGLDLISELAPVCCQVQYILLTALNYGDVRDRYLEIQKTNPRTRISLLFKPIDCVELKKLISLPEITPVRKRKVTTI